MRLWSILLVLLVVSPACDDDSDEPPESADERARSPEPEAASAEDEQPSAPDEGGGGESGENGDERSSDRGDPSNGDGASPNCLSAEERKLWNEKLAELDQSWSGEKRDEQKVASLVDTSRPFLFADGYRAPTDEPDSAVMKLFRNEDDIVEKADLFFDPVECEPPYCRVPMSHHEYHFVFRLDGGNLRMIGALTHPTATMMVPHDGWKNTRVLRDAWRSAAKALYGNIAAVRCGIGLAEKLESADVTGDEIVEREPE